MALPQKLKLADVEKEGLLAKRQSRNPYLEFIRDLEKDDAGRIEIENGVKPLTERARLKAAAKALGVDLEVRIRGNTITFWKA